MQSGKDVELLDAGTSGRVNLECRGLFATDTSAEISDNAITRDALVLGPLQYNVRHSGRPVPKAAIVNESVEDPNQLEDITSGPRQPPRDVCGHATGRVEDYGCWARVVVDVPRVPHRMPQCLGGEAG